MTVTAYPATWEFSGTVTTVEGTSWPSDITVGAPLRVLVSFDTDEAFGTRNSAPDPVTGLPRTGVRYQSFGTPSLQIAVFLGTTCAPCVPTNDASVTENNSILVRDNYQDEVRNGGPGEFDGYSFGTTSSDGLTIGVILRDLRAAFSPEVVDFTGSAPYRPMPVLPDTRMTGMATSLFQVCESTGAGNCVFAQLDTVSVPTYGTYYFLSGRHCLYADTNTGSPFFGDDCVRAPGPQALSVQSGGSAGWADFSLTEVLSWPNPTVPSQMDMLGTAFGAVAFGGPGGLPVLRGSSFPTDVGRTNSNLLAYQQYTFGGTAATPLSLIVDLGYSINSNWLTKLRPNGSEIQEGLRAGGAEIATTLSVVDAAKVPPEAMAAVKNFNSLQCGNEAVPDAGLTLPNGNAWPAGSILGMAVYASPTSQTGAHTTTLKVVRCAGAGEPANPDGTVASGDPVTVVPGQKFYLAASMQTPARGRAAQAGYPTAASDGYVDAANTLRVLPDPAAPPAVLQQLAQGLGPTCTTCDFTPEVVIDVKPGSAVNSIKLSSNGVIPVAVLGSDRLNVQDVSRASLRLGALVVRSDKRGSPQCSVSDVNVDGLPDLVCQFQNVASNWQPGQTIVTLSGKLNNGETIFASDTIKLNP